MPPLCVASASASASAAAVTAKNASVVVTKALLHTKNIHPLLLRLRLRPRPLSSSGSLFVATAPRPPAPLSSAFHQSSSPFAIVVAKRFYRAGPIHVRPIGIGSAVPSTIVTNADLATMVDTSDEWIQSRTGMQERRVLINHESLRDLAIQASRQALEMAQVDASELSVVLCASSTPDDLLGDAPSIAHALGCTSNTLAYDITAACSGFMFGITTAGALLSTTITTPTTTTSSTTSRKALVVGADALSRWVDWDDRNVCILFGDGAGAVVLETSDIPGVLGCAAHSNGAGYNDLNARYTHVPRPLATSTTADGTGDGNTTTANTTTPSLHFLQKGGYYAKVAMNGREVYKFATREVPLVLQRALDAANMTRNQIDWLLVHQANLRITEAVASKSRFALDQVLTNGPKYGNTSAASMPLALDEAVRNGQVRNGDVVACAGFGAGLSWGAAILRWGRSSGKDNDDDEGDEDGQMM